MLVTRFLATVILYIIREYAGCSLHVRLITFFKKNNNNWALGDIISLNLSITTLLNSTILYLAKKKKKNYYIVQKSYIHL